MRLGCCGSVTDAGKFADAGFDFLEANIQAVLRGDDDDKTWAAQAPDVAALPLPIEAANCLLPAGHRAVGPQRDLAALKRYMQRVAARAQRLGIQRLVFGSGAARKTNGEVDAEQAFDQLAEFCQLAGDCCAEHDVTLVIEHLNRSETDTINSLAEGVRLAQRVNHPAVKALVDSYHFGLEHEPIESLSAAGSTIAHVHIAEPVKRIEPGGHGPFGQAADAYDFVSFFRPLRQTGYDDRISLECSFSGPIEDKAPTAATMARQAWAAAGNGV